MLNITLKSTVIPADEHAGPADAAPVFHVEHGCAFDVDDYAEAHQLAVADIDPASVLAVENAAGQLAPGAWLEVTHEAWRAELDDNGEPLTARRPVKAADYARSGLNGDAWAYWYSPEAEKHGLDPWRQIEGIDLHTDGDRMDVWFSDGKCREVGPDAVVYLAPADAAKLGA